MFFKQGRALQSISSQNSPPSSVNATCTIATIAKQISSALIKQVDPSSVGVACRSNNQCTNTQYCLSAHGYCVRGGCRNNNDCTTQELPYPRYFCNASSICQYNQSFSNSQTENSSLGSVGSICSNANQCKPDLFCNGEVCVDSSSSGWELPCRQNNQCSTVQYCKMPYGYCTNGGCRTNNDCTAQGYNEYVCNANTSRCEPPSISSNTNSNTPAVRTDTATSTQNKVVAPSSEKSVNQISGADKSSSGTTARVSDDPNLKTALDQTGLAIEKDQSNPDSAQFLDSKSEYDSVQIFMILVTIFIFSIVLLYALNHIFLSGKEKDA